MKNAGGEGNWRGLGRKVYKACREKGGMRRFGVSRGRRKRKENYKHLGWKKLEEQTPFVPEGREKK